MLAVWNSQWLQVRSQESTKCVSLLSTGAWKVRSEELRRVTMTLSFGGMPSQLSSSPEAEAEHVQNQSKLLL